MSGGTAPVASRAASSPAAPRGVIALLLASVLWGTTGTAATLIPAAVSPLAIGACTMGIGGVLLFLSAPRASLSVIRSPATRRWAVIGAIGVIVYPLAFYSGMRFAGVAIGNVLALGSAPVFTAVLERMIERRPLSRSWSVSALMAIVGVALIAVLGTANRDGAAGTPHPESDASSPLLGIALALLAGVAYSLYTFASSRVISAGASGRGAMGGLFGLGAVPLLVVLVLIGGPLLRSSTSVAVSSYLVLGPMFAAYILFGIGLTTVRSSTATVVTLLEPVVATILAVVVVGERLTGFGWGGIALVTGGIVVLISASRGVQRAAPA